MKQIISVSNWDEEVVFMEVCSRYLVVATALNVVKLYDLGRKLVVVIVGCGLLSISVSEQLK